jgi:ABC-type branched-subunit amino acid transport system ATPase component
VLEVRGLVAGYGRLAVLHEVDFELATGESAAVMGANGAGKSTLMKAISKSIPVMAGSVRWNGDDLSHRSAAAVARSRVAYVPQEANVFAELTVRDNLMLGADVHSDPAPRVDTMMERFPLLRERARQQAGTLSGGERKILAVTSSLLMGPELLLLDEPTSGMAPKMSALVRDVIVSIIGEGMSVLWVVEQEPEIALEVVDRAFVMAGGEIVESRDRASFGARSELGEFLTQF